MNYEESAIRARLARLDRARRTAFAAACAERLWPLFERYVQATGEGDPGVLRGVLDAAWSLARGEIVADPAAAQHAAEDMVPTDDGAWVFEMGYGQNAIAAVAYAVRTWLSDDPQEGVWGARQVYEAADLAAQRFLPELDMNSPEVEQELFTSTAVQAALAGITRDLEAVELPVVDGWQELRERATREGLAWAGSLP